MPYPGSMKPCPCICLAAGHPVSPTLNNIKKRPGSAAMRPRPHCRSAAAHVAEPARPAAPVGTRSMSQDPSGGKRCRAARHAASRTCVRTWGDGATAARRTPAQLPGRAQDQSWVVGWQPCTCLTWKQPAGHRTYWCQICDLVLHIPPCIQTSRAAINNGLTPPDRTGLTEDDDGQT